MQTMIYVFNYLFRKLIWNLLHKSIIYIPPGSASLIQFFTVFSFAIYIIFIVNTVYTCVHSLYTVTVAYNHIRAAIQRVTFHQSPYANLAFLCRNLDYKPQSINQSPYVFMYMYIVNMQCQLLS